MFDKANDYLRDLIRLENGGKRSSHVYFIDEDATGLKCMEANLTGIVSALLKVAW